ncbi:cytoplasmic FMR1-interacting protein 1 [Histomonas meleagridis]|uniref:cytoplasmic FMR1-interacting protein 1 n=1 Tax=Histomonas meleagridis TaxID=135588 RepID=UPI003559D600|nr:cytoplasmic FMR1-interacting protein 1 [Histomonas meleagridis]KAH0801515.1 cytoplasmic FMR1-interacting protein 1 [Histomonas meleagridis]
MSSNNGIKLPSRAFVESWDDLGVIPLLDTTAKSVPSAVFVDFPNETYAHHMIYEADIPNLTAKSTLTLIKKLSQKIAQADVMINKLYSRRCYSNAITAFIKRKKVDSTIMNAAKPYYEEILALCNETMNFMIESVTTMQQLLDYNSFWSTGKYSDQLIDSMCEFFYKVSAIDEIKLVKTSLVNDLTNFKNMAKGNEFNDTNLSEIRTWMPSRNYLDTAILSKTSNKPKSEKQAIGSILANYITNAIEKRQYLRPEMLFAYLRFLSFIVKFNDSDTKTIQFLISQSNKHPLIPLAYEVSISISDLCKSVPAFRSAKLQLKLEEQEPVKSTLTKLLSNFPTEIANAESKKITPQKLYEIVLTVIKEIGSTKNILREQLAYKLANPPIVPEISSTFEKSMRKGYSEEEIQLLLQLLMLWRSLSDQLRQASETIYRILSNYFNEIFQSFIRNDCDYIIKHLPQKSDKDLKSVFQSLRELLGDILEPDENKKSSKSKQTQSSKDESVYKKSSPSPSSVEFLRIQIQHLLNPTSEMAPIKKNIGKDKSIDMLQTFLNNSLYWCDLMQFGQLIDLLSDQSDLFFKEVQLDLNKVITFPVRSSLPYVLCEYALTNYMVPELTEMIFYPIGIYDDAAHRAQQQIKSKFLLDEIKAEADICMHTLTLLISDFTFTAFKSYASIRFLPDEFAKKIKNDSQLQWPESRAYRLTNLLQQNQFYLHCRQIDVKSLIVQPIEEQMNDAIQKLIKTAATNGLSTMVAVSKGLEIIRETHRLLCEQGLALTDYNSLLKVALGDTTPTSFVSSFMVSMIKYITHKVSSKYFLRTCPLRLVPIDYKPLPSIPFGKGNLAKILKTALEPTAKLITVQHFCHFARLLDMGTITCAIQMICTDFDTIFSKFANSYEKLLQKVTIRRIADPSISATGQVIFDRFEGAYSYFTYDNDVQDLFREMRAVGNVIASAYLLDIAISNKKMTRAQVISYFKGLGLDGKYHIDLNQMYGQSLAISLGNQNPIPSSKDSFPTVVSLLLSSVSRNLANKKGIFEEKSKTVLDFPSLTGFAAVWSVLEFTFVHMEAFRSSQVASPFATFGEGVMLCAAAIIATLRHERLYFATNIGRKIQKVKDVDFDVNGESKLAKFCAVNSLENNSMNWALSFVQPIIRHLRITGLLE